MSLKLDTCAWKLVKPQEFILGQEANRCGEVAAVKILRPNRKSDLFLCEFHLNTFIKHWGLHNEVELQCLNWVEGTRPPVVGYSRIIQECPYDCSNCRCECGSAFDSCECDE